MGKADGSKVRQRKKGEDAGDEDEDASREGPVSGKKKDAKKKGGREMDAFELMQVERRAEQKQRIVDRFLRLLLIGYIMDFVKGTGEAESSNGKDSKETKGKKKGPNSGKGESDGMSAKDLKQKANSMGPPLMMAIFALLLIIGKVAEEGYDPADDEHGFNFYEVMGVSRSADQMEIRKAYKALALKYHPDKNPDCAECVETFDKITKSYDTLSNPEARKAYDSGRRAKKTLESQSSVELTPEDFEHQVLRSNQVWYVQAYDPNNPTCKNFATGWEDVAHSFPDAKFGRLDVTRKELKALLPFQPVFLPVVFRYARGQPVEHWMFSDRRDDEDRAAGGGQALKNFLQNTFPEFRRLDSAKDLKSWMSTQESRILVVGPSSSSSAAKFKDYMPVLSLAHGWEQFFSFASVSAADLTEAFGEDYALGRGKTWALVLKGSDGSMTKAEVGNVADMASLIQDFISDEIPHQAPVATVRNANQLCGDATLNKDSKNTYCLFLVDASADATAKALTQLNSSRAAYYQEVQELRNSGEDSEEPFRIQPVRVATGSSRLPWNPAAPGPSFSGIWAQAAKAGAFVLDLESRKFAAIKAASLNELFQNIAYEDLKLDELSEDGPALDRLFSDPETSLRQELKALVYTVPGMILAVILFAGIVSVAPEVEEPALPAAVGSAATLVVLLLSPALMQRFIRMFWCMLSSSSFECQQNF